MSTVYVVRPEDPAEDVLVFAREDDAESYSRARWGSAWPMIEAAPIIGQTLAQDMIAREEEGESGASPPHGLAETLIGIAAAGDPELADLLTIGELEDLVAHGFEQIARVRFGEDAVDFYLHDGTQDDEHERLVEEAHDR